MSEQINRFDAVRRELAETAQRLSEVIGNPQRRIALLRRMRGLLDEADKISREDIPGDPPLR